MRSPAISAVSASRDGRSIGVGFLTALLTTCAIPAFAADPLLLQVKAPPAAPAENYRWDGFYFGGHVGFGHGDVRAMLTEPTTWPIAQQFTTPYAGVQTEATAVATWSSP